MTYHYVMTITYGNSCFESRSGLYCKSGVTREEAYNEIVEVVAELAGAHAPRFSVVFFSLEPNVMPR